MRIGIDLNASQFQSRLERRASLVFSLALVALAAGCNAVADFGDFEFGPRSGDKRDSGVADSGLAADGGETDAGPVGADADGSVSAGDAGTGSDGSVTNDASTGADGSVADGGAHDAGANADSGMLSCSSTVEICDNGVDDDCDTHSDCDDDDCVGLGSCCSATPENTQLACGDGRDNDCSGQKDCDDLNCSGTLACCTKTGAENSAGVCGDGIDDDCDGKVDCADPECAGLAACCAIVVESGGGTGTACCTPDGLNESDQPNDGKDNDCDGLVDIPSLLSAFPTQGLPSSADEVRLNFMTEISPSATLACSTTRPGQAQSFSACPLAGTTVKPFTAIQSANAANNGLWITQVRWDFPDGRHSSSYTFRYYLHSSLHNVSHCVPFHSDAQWFNKAHTLLGATDAGAFKLGIDTFLSSPFIRVTYKVPVSGQAQFKLTGQTPSLDMWSLRRRFSLNATGKYLLIQRNYKATRSGSCNAAAFQIHDTHAGTNKTFRTYSCQAVVLNRAGVGVCLNNAATTTAEPILPHPSNDPLSNAIGWTFANKFMWRQLLETSAGNTRNFTPKCATQPCAGTFLPDRTRFSP